MSTKKLIRQVLNGYVVGPEIKVGQQMTIFALQTNKKAQCRHVPTLTS